jgi:hypothetical protein
MRLQLFLPVFCVVRVAQSLVLLFLPVFCVVRVAQSLVLLFIPVFCGVRVALSLVFCIIFSRLLFVLFSFGHWFVCASKIYGF